ncbi:MAG: hypothetical protein ACOVQE_10030 [Chitinophagaceae bacterium]
MKKYINLIVIVLSVLCNLHAQETSTTYLHSTNEYAISFPYEPVKSIQKIPSAVGELTMTIFMYENKNTEFDKNLVYMIMESDYPDSLINSNKKENLAGFFRGAINGAVRNSNGKLLKETEVMYNNFPGRTIEIDYGNGMAIIKLTMVLRYNKAIMVQTIAETEHSPNKMADAFLNSFIVK